MSAKDNEVGAASKKRSWLSRHKRTLMVAGASMGLSLGQLFLRNAPRLENPSGDPELVQWLASKEVRAKRLSVVLVDHGVARHAHWNADEKTLYELGSISKALTGLVMADAESKGELHSSMQAQAMGLAGVEGQIGAITLESLATHHSGLPRLAMTWETALRAYRWLLFGTGPYTGDVQAVVSDAKLGPLGEAKFEYSNLGASLLGQLLAARIGIDYASLMQTRLFAPLGMKDSGVQVSQAMVEPGTSARGGEHEPWVMGGYAPCGGAVSSPRDMETLLRALLQGRAPGMKALEPRADASSANRENKIGYFWYLTPCPERYGRDKMMVWHNGGTGGYASFVGIDRAGQRGVAIMAASAVELDAYGVELLCGELRLNAAS